MKTQISSLINGSKNVRRDLNNKKYELATMSTSHIGYAGSSQITRTMIAQQVLSENETKMTIFAFGETISLDRYNSLSGKTSEYISELTEDQFLKFSNLFSNPITTKQSKFSLKINGDMTVEIDVFARKSDNSLWKQRISMYIDESFIEIL